MPRGYVWAYYTDDAGAVWGLQVDADYQLQTGRGFEQLAGAGTAPLPRGWLARRVVGVEETGRSHTATVASLEAPLWTGSERTFDIVDTNGQLQTCTVVKWLDERTRARPGAAAAGRI
jgi:hypothetical protein